MVGQSANHFIKAWALSIWITYQLKIWKKSNKIKTWTDEQKEKLIAEIDEIEKQRKNIKKGKSKKQKPKKSSKPIPKPKPESETFDDYFEECIKNKKIQKDSPSYLKKALGRAMKEYDVGIKHEKSALENFVDNK